MMPSSADWRSSAKRLEMRVELEGAVDIIFEERLKQAGVRVHVLITAAGEIEDDEVVLGKLREALDEAGECMSRFKSRNNAFGAREQSRGIESGVISDGIVLRASLVGEPGVLRTDGRIIEAGRNRMRGGDLAIFVL